MAEILFECDKCGSAVKQGVNFCANCGAELDWDDDDTSSLCPKCHEEISKNDLYCSKCGAKINSISHSKEEIHLDDSNSVSAIDSESLSEICEYINGIVSVFLILFTAPLLLAIFILYEINKLKQGLSDEEVIVRLKTVRRYCTWSIVLSIIQFPVFVLIFPIIIFPIIAFRYVLEIRKMADGIINDYESKHLD